MSKKSEKKKKKKRGGGGIIIVLLIIIAILLVILYYVKGSGFGTGGDSVPADGTLPTLPVTAAVSENAGDEQKSEEQNNNTVIIEISEETISVNGTAVADAEALREKLLSIGSGDTTYVISDDHAVKSVYDSAKAVLDDLGWEYSDQTAN